jgi:hypothetical protein
MQRAQQSIALWLVAGTLLVSTPSASGQTITALSVGNPTCGTWVENRRHRQRLTEDLEIWAAGYLSGAAMGTRKDFLAGFDIGAVFAWLDNSCRANPLQPFTASLNALVRERVGAASQ